MDEITSPLDTPLLLAAAAVIGVLLIVALTRRLLRMTVILVLLGLIVVGLYWARAEGYLSW